jgi:hypothetical protein
MCGRARPVTLTFYERPKLPETIRASVGGYAFFLLPEGDDCAGWIAENAHVAVAHDLADIDDDPCAGRFCFGGGGVDVVDTDVGQPHGERAGHECVVHDHAGNIFELLVEEF